MKKILNQKGFSPLILILLILLLLALGFAAWRVLGSDSDKPSDSSESTSTTKETPDEPAVTYAKPISEAYQVVQPDAWVKGTCPDNPDLLFLAPSSDKLGKCQTESFGTVSVTKNAGDSTNNEEYYTGDDYYGSVSYSAVTIDGITGYKVGYTIAGESELGYPPIGTKQVLYVLYDGTNTYTIAYGQMAGDADHAATAQAIAESFDKL